MKKRETADYTTARRLENENKNRWVLANRFTDVHIRMSFLVKPSHM